MAFDTPPARHLAVTKTSSGISLAHGALSTRRPLDAKPGFLARDTVTQKPHCETSRLTGTPAMARKAPLPIRPAAAPAAAASSQKMPVMRRYEVTFLGANGEIDSSRHVAPATPQFEAAFSAFARGTLMATTQGLCAIEDLLPGMQIETAEFGPCPVLWIGSMTILPDAPVETPDQTRMTRIMADTFGMGRPMADVMAGPGARLLHRPAALRELNGTGARSGQVFTPVSDFEDGMNTIRITPPRPVTVYHLCLDRHASIKVSGMDMESFHPGLGLEQRMGPNMLALFLSLFPHIRSLDDFGPLAYPRATRDTLDSLTAA
ncbi:MAG: Hint domain-containing protein [Paracoccaceae bacterium]|nr:Hint domain-containing protein [Paracoccaceae bacterium]